MAKSKKAKHTMPGGQMMMGGKMPAAKPSGKPAAKKSKKASHQFKKPGY